MEVTDSGLNEYEGEDETGQIWVLGDHFPKVDAVI